MTGDKTPPPPPFPTFYFFLLLPTRSWPLRWGTWAQSLNPLTTCLFSKWSPPFTNHSLAPEGREGVGGIKAVGLPGSSFSLRATTEVRKGTKEVG